MITEYGTDSERQDSCFYSDGSGATTAWSDDCCDYYVVASGVMDIRYTAPDGTDHRIYDTDTLCELGFDTDNKIAKMSGKAIDEWEWANNNWFEVYSDTDLDFCSEPIDTLDEAVAYAIELSGTGHKHKSGQEPDLVYWERAK